jgi:hypothetical protein
MSVACTKPDAGIDSSRPAPRSTSPKTDWVVTPRGLGPLEAGMSRADAERVVGASLAIAGDSNWTNCGYTPTDHLPPGVRVMVEGGTIARVDVDSSAGIATAEGARVGDSEDRIHQLYGARVTVTPHKYIAGHYLTVAPAQPSDSLYRIIFETDGHRVLRYRAGRMPPVQYIEGCG